MKYLAPALAVLFLLTILPVCNAQTAAKTAPAELRKAFENAGIPVLKEKMPIWDFTVTLLDGKDQRLSGYRGKVVFLNFWATWCPPCRAEMPSMETLYQRYRGRDLEFLAVDIQESRDEVADFLKEQNLSFPAGLDSTGQIASLYGIRGIPTTFIIDKEGSIIAAIVGGREWDTPAVFAAFDLLLR
ncbi:MAG: TlpA family protein disulfide reductase [Treponema sp.]|jgi:thiol-disulfide isomerase/thioredoxin|nr:TlpA family protein disulfide reductase [Treponema sp.]